MRPYQSPDFELNAFNCPHCQAYANVHKSQMFVDRGIPVKGFFITTCTHCHMPVFWRSSGDETKVMEYPIIVDAPAANSDLSEEIRKDFEEARLIANSSPRAAAALLRLAIQKLCKVLGAKGDHINEDIKFLVGKGLPEMIQQSLDIVRVIGNESVHPGSIDLNDDRETTRQLFLLLNLITETMITQPRMVKQLYDTLPADKRAAIEKRDGTIK